MPMPVGLYIHYLDIYVIMEFLAYSLLALSYEAIAHSSIPSVG